MNDSTSCRRLSSDRRESDRLPCPAAQAIQRTPSSSLPASWRRPGEPRSTVDGDRESLLHNYLVLIRRSGDSSDSPLITLRDRDISALAEHLGASEERVLGDLLDRMGATRAQRKALMAMFAAGVLTIVATGSVALDLAPAGGSYRSAASEGVAGVVDVPVTVTAAALEQPLHPRSRPPLRPSWRASPSWRSHEAAPAGSTPCR